MSRFYDYDDYEGGGRAKKIIFWACIAVVAALIISAFVAISVKLEKLETFEEVPTSAYSRGVLDDATGKVDSEDEDTLGIYTSQFFTVDGIKCVIADEAEISYQINWYDEDKNFISVSNFTEDFNAVTDADTIPEDAEFFKVEILPNDDADGKIGAFEVSKYAKMLTVTYDKK